MPDDSPRDSRLFTFYSFRLFKSQVPTCIYWRHSARVVCRVGAVWLWVWSECDAWV